MNYLLDKNTVFKSRRRRGKTGGVFFVLLIILILFLGGGLVYKIASPLFTSVALSDTANAGQDSIATTVSLLTPKTKLIAENKKLNQEVETLKARLASQKSLTAELEVLRQATNRFTESAIPTVARVFDRPPHLPFDVLLVDVGRDKAPNLSLGDLAVLDGNILLGEVVQIFDSGSKIKLYSSPETVINVTVGPNNVPAKAHGSGGGTFSAELPRGVQINPGDQVLTEKNGSYILGSVSKVDNDPRNPLQVIFISLPVNIHELVWINILPRS